MKKCNQCGAWIDFVTTQAGRHMPVEPRPVVIMPNRGTDTFITPDGKMIYGQRALVQVEGFGNIAAYVPHWAWCRKEPTGRAITQLAKWAGVSPGVVRHITRGAEAHKAETVDKLADALGVAVCNIIKVE